MRLVKGLPFEGFYREDFSWLGAILLFATEVKADLEAKAGGLVGQNLDHVYSLSPSDLAYLQTLLQASGVSVDTVDNWLAAMNARTILQFRSGMGQQTPHGVRSERGDVE